MTIGSPSRVRARAVATGLTGGFFSGLTGVGGGTIMVPLLRRLQGLPQHRAHGTSLAIVIFVGTAGLIGYWINDNVDWHLALWLAVGSAFGSYAGAVAMSRLAPRALQLTFGVFLLTVGIRMFFA
ncbi:MAG: sulfite exporter TauE/SafE family protein [Dehalococcoidia bacterium]